MQTKEEYMFPTKSQKGIPNGRPSNYHHHYHTLALQASPHTIQGRSRSKDEVRSDDSPLVP